MTDLGQLLTGIFIVAPFIGAIAMSYWRKTRGFRSLLVLLWACIGVATISLVSVMPNSPRSIQWQTNAAIIIVTCGLISWGTMTILVVLSFRKKLQIPPSTKRFFRF